ncbi:MAG: von Willebrand factor type A domain-containing protein [Chitinophagales bacterium]
MKKRTLGIAGFLLIVSGVILGTTISSENKEISFTGNSVIKGTITDKATGEPLFGCTVTIEGSTFGTVSDIDGRYEIQKLEAGKYDLTFTYIGFEKLTIKEIVVSENETKIADAQLDDSSVSLDEVMVIEHKQQDKVKLSKKAETSSTNNITAYPLSGADMSYADEEEFYNEGFNTESYNTINENGFKKTIGNPLSTFSIDVDNASYSNIRRFISYGETPPKDAVRIEEMVNYFDYTYPKPTGDDPFAVNMEISDCPWNAESKLVMIALQGKDIDYSNTDLSNLVFLIDVSGSMQDPNKLGLVKKSLSYLVDNLREEDKIALVVYAGAAGLVLPSTPASEKQKIKDAINKLEAGGSTAGGAGINLAYKVALDNFIKGGNNRVILCTDGDFNVGVSSDAEMTRLIEEKRTTGVFITVCGFGMGNYKDSKMEQIADNGNGSYYYIDAEKEAKKVFGADLKGTLFTIAKDVKIQIEFNPAKVEEYRLIGYENRLLNKEDFEDDKKDAGELGAGHKVTAMYEVKLRKGSYEPKSPDTKNQTEELKYQVTEVKPDAYYSDDILNLKLRYKEPDGDVSKLIEKSVKDTQIPFTQTSDNFRFACSVVEFGMLLRESEHKGSATYEEVIKLALNAKGADANGYRDEFIQLVQSYIGFAQK